MRAEVITVQGEIHSLKARAFIERHEQGLFIISDGHSNQTLLVVKSADLVSYIPTGKPKPPKAKREPRTENLTLDITSSTAQAMLDEMSKLISDDQLDPSVYQALITGLGLNELEEALQKIYRRLDNLEASRDSQAQQIENIGHNEQEWAKQCARITAMIGEEELNDPRFYVLCGIRADIQPPSPTMPGPTIRLDVDMPKGSTALPDPVAIDETTKFPGKRRAKADIQDDQRITPTEGSKSACSGCGRYTRHSVNCTFMDEGVQSEPCNEALGKPE